jgi:SAM-dependent methyltransferase
LVSPDAGTRPFRIASQAAGFWSTVRAAGRRQLPARYQADLWDRRFRQALESHLEPGSEILDLGAGRSPTVSRSQRPVNTRYVGLDIDADELEAAESGAYDQTVALAGEQRVAEFEEQFDLVLSFFALEHVRSTRQVLENAHAYLRPGGTLIAQFAGARSPFSLLNRGLPYFLARTVLARTQGRKSDSVFTAHYDSCSHTGLTRLLAGRWSEYEVLPLFAGAGYVLFSRVLTAWYIAYEELIYRAGRRDLAPYYLAVATK